MLAVVLLTLATEPGFSLWSSYVMLLRTSTTENLWATNWYSYEKWMRLL